VAVVMGANRVFVAGMDGYLNANSVKSTLFYEEKFDPKEHELNVERHRWNDMIPRPNRRVHPQPRVERASTF
jgi:hypothetical protein